MEDFVVRPGPLAVVFGEAMLSAGRHELEMEKLHDVAPALH